MKGHFISKTTDGFDWKGFQAHMGYSDEELEALKADPKKSAFVQGICTEEFQDKYFVAEVVDAHGCVAGLEPGDRIVFKGLTVLDPEHSTAWCPYMQNFFWYTNNARNFLLNGLDPNASYAPYSGCMDVGSENGLGRTVFKTYVLDKKDLDQLK